MVRQGFCRHLLIALTFAVLGGFGCARGQPPPDSPRRLAATGAAGAKSLPAEPEAAPAEPIEVKPRTPEERLEELRRRIEAELAHPDWNGARVSLLVEPARGGTSLVSVEPEVHRVPASNAKVLTSLAALKALAGRYAFVTEVYLRGGRLYLWGTGDPVLRGAELVALARQLKARGVYQFSHVVVDDSHFDRRRLAPGFESFSEGSYYRPTSGALNVDGNAVMIAVSAPKGRRRPRVDVLPPSDYVGVRKLVRFAAKRSRKPTRIKVSIRPKGHVMWVTVAGTFRRGARLWRTRRAVYDPALNLGWALRRAMVNEGVKVNGVVYRGRRPRKAKPLVRKVRPLGAILTAVLRDSDNLAAETLVRAMGALEPKGRRRGTWPQGLAALERILEQEGLEGFWLGNGSGLHRKSWVTARLMVSLLQRIFADARARAALVPALAVAGRSGTLARRMRGSAAEGVVVAKTGTMGGALALSGLVDPTGAAPLAFSLLVNGRSDRTVRYRMDRVATLLAHYVKDTPPAEEPAPASQPASAPATQPADAPATQPASAPATQPTEALEEILEEGLEGEE